MCIYGKIIVLANLYADLPEIFPYERDAVKIASKDLGESLGILCLKTQLNIGSWVSILKEEQQYYFVESFEQFDYDTEKNFYPISGWIRKDNINIDSECSESLTKIPTYFPQDFQPINNEICRSKIVDISKTYLDTSYLWGGRSRNGIDCSALVDIVYRSIGINIPRFSSGQFKVSRPILISELLPGDLIFVGDKKNNQIKIVHVFIYLEDETLIESNGIASINKVRLTTFENSFNRKKSSFPSDITEFKHNTGRKIYLRRLKIF